MSEEDDFLKNLLGSVDIDAPANPKATDVRPEVQTMANEYFEFFSALVKAGFTGQEALNVLLTHMRG